MKPETIMIDDVTYIRADRVKQQAQTLDGMEYVIVRANSAGVFAGYVKRKELHDGRYDMTLVNVRRLWQWYGASLSQVAVDGLVDYSKCKIPCVEASKELPSVFEIMPCTEKARLSIEGAPIWKL